MIAATSQVDESMHELNSALGMAWSAEASLALPPPAPELHLLSRLTFGARPGEPARLAALGLEAFIEEQLAPEAIDDSETEAEVARLFPDLELSAAALHAFQDADPTRYGAHPRQLRTATLYRALTSRRQLYERMVEFWSDHFSIYQLKGQDKILKTIDDREVIRPHAMGRFRDLLRASAHSTAMLFYLDNQTNVKAGPNENYARELLELHTLGVDGGYSHHDVVEVARCFTGWGMRFSDEGFGQFIFRAANHDTGTKMVLGQTIAVGGEGDGNAVLDLIAAHPATARFIAGKLCRRFIGDTPPSSVIDAAAATFTATDGDIRAVLRTILRAPEFAAATDQKLKRPIDFVVSALRVLPSRFTVAGLERLASTYLSPMAQSPFLWEPPNGYPDVAGAWATTSGLLFRWNCASALSLNRIRGVAVDFPTWARRLDVRTPRQLVDQLAARLLQRPLLPADHAALLLYAAREASPDLQIAYSAIFQRAPGVAALLLASPYFNWR